MGQSLKGIVQHDRNAEGWANDIFLLHSRRSNRRFGLSCPTPQTVQLQHQPLNRLLEGHHTQRIRRARVCRRPDTALILWAQEDRWIPLIDPWRTRAIQGSPAPSFGLRYDRMLLQIQQDKFQQRPVISTKRCWTGCHLAYATLSSLSISLAWLRSLRRERHSWSHTMEPIGPLHEPIRSRIWKQPCLAYTQNRRCSSLMASYQAWNQTAEPRPPWDYLLRALRSEADTNRNGDVTLGEAVMYLSQKVRWASKTYMNQEQRPLVAPAISPTDPSAALIITKPPVIQSHKTH